MWILAVKAHETVTKSRYELVMKWNDKSIPITLVHLSDHHWKAFDSICPHSGGPLFRGPITKCSHQESSDIEDIIVTCPWHEYKFSLNQGCGIENEFMIQTWPVKETVDGIYIDVEEGYSIESVHPFEVPSVAPSCPAVQVPVSSPRTLLDYANIILMTSDASRKVKLTNEAALLWQQGKLEMGEKGTGRPPIVPPREANMIITAPGKAKRLGKGGTTESKIAILHSLANIEQWAIDLAWDIIARFADYSFTDTSDRFLPRSFFSDFVKVAQDEAKHFTILVKRMEELGGVFGSLPVHDGLWDSASETQHDILCRLAIVHMVHEARGLDVNPKTLEKFRNQKDFETVEVLDIIHQDEITHVAAGQRWFSFIVAEMQKQGLPIHSACCSDVEKENQIPSRYSLFHSLVRKHFRGMLKPPFNTQDRLKAGLDPQYYLPLAN